MEIVRDRWVEREEIDRKRQRRKRGDIR